MLFRKKNRPRERFYLLPGQGGRNFRQKQRRFRHVAIFVAVIFGALIGVVMWWLARLRI